MGADLHHVDAARDGRPIRILICYSRTSADRALGLSRELVALEEVFDRIGHTHKLEFEVLRYGLTRKRIMERVVERGGYDIVHFGGHGERDVLVLERDDGSFDPVPGQEFAHKYLAPPGTRRPALVFLAACHSATTLGAAAMRELRASLHGQASAAPAMQIGGAALGLLLAGIPQVIGMRFEVDDGFARALTVRFYEFLLAHGRPASRAVALAVSELREGDHRPRNHQAPVVFSAADVSFTLAEGESIQRWRRTPRPDPAPGGIERPLTFAGRELELTRLRNDWLPDGRPVLGPLRSLKPGTAILHGEPGVGVSTLAAQVIHQWHADFELVLAVRGQCTLQSWLRDCVHDGLRDGSPQYRRACDAEDHTTMVWLTTTAEENQTRLRARMIGNLLKRTRQQAILFVFDNLEENLRPSPAGAELWDPELGSAIAKLASALPGTGSRMLLATSLPLAAGFVPHALEVPVPPLSEDEMLLVAQDVPGFEELARGSANERAALLRAIRAAGGRPGDIGRKIEAPPPPAPADRAMAAPAPAPRAEAGATGSTSVADEADPIGHHLRRVVVEQSFATGPLRHMVGDPPLLPRLSLRSRAPRPVWAPTSLDEAHLEAARGLRHPFDAIALLSQSADRQSERPGRWLLSSDAGSGKTTLLRWLALHLARIGERTRIPVWCRASALLDASPSLLEALEESERRAGPGATGLARALDEAGREGRLVLLLDGLDEVEPSKLQDTLTLLRELTSRYERSTVIAASRLTVQMPADDFMPVEILPFDRDARISFIAGLLGGSDGRPDSSGAASAAVDELAAQPGLWHLAGTPLFLTLIGLLLRAGGDGAATGRWLEDALRPMHLYDRVFQVLLEGSHRGDQRPIPNQAAVRSALRHLAYVMTGRCVEARSPAELESYLLAPEAAPVREALALHPPWRDDLRCFLRDVAVRTAILGPHDGQPDVWQFWHRSFREALAAEALMERLITDGRLDPDALRRELDLQEMRTGSDLDTWAEPYSLLAEAIAEPDEYVSQLLDARRDLGLRALATVQGVKIETIEAALALTADWRKRRTVYDRLPILAGGAIRGMILADRLLSRYHSGNDLFFIDRFMALAERAHPAEAQRIGLRRGRLFAHVPPPDAGLFETIEIRERRVPLFCSIRAGGHAFRVSIVPVTNGQFAAFDASRAGAALARHPATRVSWYDSVMFCRWLSSAFPWARGARLPTEREWEIAAGALLDAEWLDAVAWHGETSGRRAHQVGEKEPNASGLYDVFGNVWEWCADAWSEGASDATPDDADAWRVLRGGCFLSSLEDLRETNARSASSPERASDLAGFRVLLPDPGADP